MTLLERFDRLVAELRKLFEEAQSDAEIIAQLRAFVGQGRPGRPPGRSRRSPARRPPLSGKKRAQIKQRIARFLARAREGASNAAIAKAVGLRGFRLRRLLDELRGERQVRMRGDRGGARYFAASDGTQRPDAVAKGTRRPPARKKPRRAKRPAARKPTTKSGQATNRASRPRARTSAARPKAAATKRVTKTRPLPASTTLSPAAPSAPTD